MKPAKFILRECSIVFIILMILFTGPAGKASSYTWVGGDASAPNSWSNVNNWKPAMPGSADDVTITTSTYYPTVDVNATIASLTFNGSGATLNFDGTHTLTVNGSVNISSKTAKISTGSSKIIINGSLSGLGTIDLTGNGTIQLTGDMSVSSFIAGTSGTSTVMMTGTSQTINNSYEFNNLQIGTSSSTSVTFAASQKVDGNLSGSGTLSSGNYALTLLGNMSVSSFNAGTGSVALNGSSVSGTQNLSGYTFYNLSVNNLNTYLTGNVTIRNNLDFQSGDISLQSSNITISQGATLTWNGSSTLNYASGYFVTGGTGQLSMTAGSSGTVFPVGPTSSNYDPITVTTFTGSAVFNVLASTGITNKNNTTVTSNAVNLTWLVVPSSNISNVVVTPQWTDTSATGVNQELPNFNRNYTYVAVRNSLTSNWSATSTYAGSTGSNPFSRGSGSLNMTAGTSYYLGVIDITSPLPVTLTEFDANYEDGKVILSWNTASESNNSYFEIQRSEDGVQWSFAGRVEGHGNAQGMNDYEATDNLDNVSASIVYYRLKQVDFNNEYTYSIIKSVKIPASQQLPVSNYPNPVKDICNLNWVNPSTGITVLKVMNINGNLVYSEKITGEGAIQKQVNFSNYPVGTYFIQIVTTSAVASRTITKN
jgi:hypothetical protein